MDAATLSRAMGGSLSDARYAELAPAFNAALVQADCRTVNRAAMWCAQLGHESGGLRWMEEIASGAAYEGRRDLGNVRPGDGRRFKGHGPIQITGRHNHTKVSEWAHDQGYVPHPRYFVDHPAQLASDRYGFLGPVWYWTVARPRINAMCDAGDLVGVTRAINGGTNGLADRRRRWDNCRRLGDALLPTGDPQEDDLDAEQNRMLREVYMQLVQGTGRADDPRSWGWQQWGGGTGEHLTAIDMLRRSNVEVRQLRNQVAALQAELTQLKNR